MTTEQQAEQANPLNDTAKLEEVEVQPTLRRVSYKSVLAAVVVGIITISGLWLFVIRQEGSPSSAVPVSGPSIQTHETAGTEVARTEGKYDLLDRRLASLSGRIDLGFETQKSHSTDVKRSLTAMAESVRMVKESVTALSESNKELSRRIGGAVSRLDTLVKNVHALKVVKRKPTAKSKRRPIETPPFHIDAIDIWDDATYVAVSQAGRVAFLKEGEQQSGWTVTHIDRLKGHVDLQGPAGQDPSISLQR